jgi:hypothetical protein
VEAFSERGLEDLLARCLLTLGEARELLLRQVGSTE